MMIVRAADIDIKVSSSMDGDKVRIEISTDRPVVDMVLSVEQAQQMGNLLVKIASRTLTPDGQRRTK